MSKHTPGPWAVRGYQIRSEGGAGAHVATWQISQVDGDLLAAAPDLFEFVEALTEMEWDEDDPTLTLRNIRTAAFGVLDRVRQPVSK